MSTRFVLLLCLLALPTAIRAGEIVETPNGKEAETSKTDKAPPAPADADAKVIDFLLSEAATASSQGDQLDTAGKPGEAIAAYHKALGYLDVLQKKFPEWNPTTIADRRHQIKKSLLVVQNKNVAEAGKPGNHGYELKRPMEEVVERVLRRRAADELIEKGDDLIEQGLPGAAIPYFQEALRYDPGNQDAQGHLEYAEMHKLSPAQETIHL